MPFSGFMKRVKAPFRRLRLSEFPPAELRVAENELHQAQRTLRTFEQKLRDVERDGADYKATEGQIKSWAQKVADLRKKHATKFRELMDK